MRERGCDPGLGGVRGVVSRGDVGLGRGVSRGAGGYEPGLCGVRGAVGRGDVGRGCVWAGCMCVWVNECVCAGVWTCTGAKGCKGK